jgi:hypothetical protein
MNEINISYGTFQFKATSGYPVPLISISQDFQRNAAGKEIGATLTINLEGKIVVPFNSGSDNMSFLLAKESGLRRNLVDGNTLSIGSAQYSGIKVNRYNTEKTPNNWTQYINYSIDLVSEISQTGSGYFLVSSAQDEWSIETEADQSYNPSVSLSLINLRGSINGGLNNAEFPFYRITRTLQAVGKYGPLPPVLISGSLMPTGTSALNNAEAWVTDHLNKFKITSVIDNNLLLYNFVRSINKSETEGSYRVTDTWLASRSGTGDWIETCTIDSSLSENMIRTVTVNGSIKGLEKFNKIESNDNDKYKYLTTLSSGIKATYNRNLITDNSDKFTNAIKGYLKAKPGIFNKANQFATTGIKYGSFSVGNFNNRLEAGLNAVPASASETFKPLEGIIDYSYSYTNRPSGIIAGSITENISINDKNAVPVVISTPILFRPQGPLFQDLGTYTVSTRTVNITANFPRTGILGLTFPSSDITKVTGVIEQFDPINLAKNIPGNKKYIRSFVKNSNIDWNIKDNSITASKTWDWTISYTGD